MRMICIGLMWFAFGFFGSFVFWFGLNEWKYFSHLFVCFFVVVFLFCVILVVIFDCAWPNGGDS